MLPTTSEPNLPNDEDLTQQVEEIAVLIQEMGQLGILDSGTSSSTNKAIFFPGLEIEKNVSFDTKVGQGVLTGHIPPSEDGYRKETHINPQSHQLYTEKTEDWHLTLPDASTVNLSRETWKKLRPKDLLLLHKTLYDSWGKLPPTSENNIIQNETYLSAKLRLEYWERSTDNYPEISGVTWLDQGLTGVKSDKIELENYPKRSTKWEDTHGDPHYDTHYLCLINSAGEVIVTDDSAHIVGALTFGIKKNHLIGAIYTWDDHPLSKRFKSADADTLAEKYKIDSKKVTLSFIPVNNPDNAN